jgi:hypothetical protein
MEPEPEDEEQAAAAAATEEAPDGSAVLAARVGVAGHEVAVDSTALDVRRWKLTAAQVREVAGALPQLLCLRELVLDGVPVSGATPRYGDFQCGVEAVDADLGMFQALCEALRALQGLTSLSLGGCYLGPQALAVLAEVVFRDASAVLASVNFCGNGLTGAAKEFEQWKNIDSDLSGFVSLCTVLGKVTEVNLSDCGLGPASMPELANIFSDPSAAIEKVNVSGCNVTKETAAQLLTAANEASRVRLRTHQLLTFSEAFHERLGSECLLQAVAFNADIWGRVAENVRERHGHELMCSQLAQAGQTWFEVTVEGFLVLDPLLDDPLGWLEYVLDPRSPRGFLADG